MCLVKMVKCVCNKHANFGFPNGKASCCTTCKEDGMVDVIHKRCKCGKHMSFGVIGGKPTNCTSCKTKDMVNVAHKMCPCGKSPSYGIKGDKAICCVECKTNDMINVSHKMCPCGKRPYFGFIGDPRPTCCTSCKTYGMTNIKDKLCPCGKIPIFGIIGSKATCCMVCKTENMVNVRHRRCKCGKQTYYKLPGSKMSTHCLDCKTDDMVDTKYNRCLSKFCDVRVQMKYDNYCTHCFANLFPDDPRTLMIQKKSKEIKVVSYISQNIEGFVHDKPLYVDLKGGCCDSKRRIDLRKLIGNTMLCIEIDENEHKYYNKNEEDIRYDNLFMDFSGKYIFIRYNPDKFKIDGKAKNPRFETRMEKLIKEINIHSERINNDENTELMEIHKLFYSSTSLPPLVSATSLVEESMQLLSVK